MKSVELTVAAGCAALLFAMSCTDQNKSKRQASQSEEPALPSVVDDKPSLASVDTSRALHQLPTVAVEPSPDRDSAPELAAAMPEDFSGLLRFAKGMGPQDADRALEALERARALRPRSAMPDIESARVHLGAGRPDAARPFAEAALEIDPSSSYAWNTMGRVELSEGEIEAALASFERAAEENEDNSYAWNNLGLTLMRLERYPEAATALERATSGANPSAFMFNNLGMAYEHLARFDLAGAAYRQAQELGSNKAAANLERLERDGVDFSPPVGSDGDGSEVVPPEIEVGEQPSDTDD